MYSIIQWSSNCTLVHTSVHEIYFSLKELKFIKFDRFKRYSSTLKLNLALMLYFATFLFSIYSFDHFSFLLKRSDFNVEVFPLIFSEPA